MQLFVFIPALVMAFPCLAEQEVQLVNWQKLGVRGKLDFAELYWECDCPWFGAKVMVYQAAERQYEPPQFIAPLAESLSLTKSVPHNDLGSPPEHLIRYDGPPLSMDAPFMYQKGMLLYYPERREFGLYHRGLWDYPRDELLQPKIQRPPDRQVCYANAQEWIAKIGVRNAELFPGPGPDRKPFAAFGETTIRWFEGGDIKEPRSVVQELYVAFYQKIGDLRATGWGIGGKVRFTYMEANRLQKVRYSLRKWEAFGEFDVLDRAEVEDALRSGFAFGVPPLKCEKLKITEVELLAACMPPDEPQRHATPLYQLRVTAEGGPMDGTTESLFIPALRIHRHAYDPPGGEAKGAEGSM